MVFDAVQVIDELVSDVAGGVLGSAGGRFFGWGHWRVCARRACCGLAHVDMGSKCAIHACGPAEAVIEEICGSWAEGVA